MAKDTGLDWKSQLQQLRGDVEELERRRAEDERLRLQRSREAIQERLKKDTAETLPQQLQEIRKECDRAARRFYPPDGIEEARSKLLDFVKRMEFYKECRKDFTDLFSAGFNQACDRCRDDAGNIDVGLDRQLRQWSEIREILGDVGFRSKADADNVPLVAAAKTFSETAHGLGLGLPADYFAGEGEGFHIVTHQDKLLGYIKYWEDRKVITFALTSPIKLNFPKFVRAVLYRAYRYGPLAGKKLPAVRVRLSMAKEVKFFTDLAFVRSETLSVNEWVYERPLD